MHCRFQAEDRHLGRLDADMTEHLLIGRLDALTGEHHRYAARLIREQRHRPDLEFGATIECPRPGELALAHLDDPPFAHDGLLAAVTPPPPNPPTPSLPLPAPHPS